MESASDVHWPVDMLGRFLHFLALDGAGIAWQQLAYLTQNNSELRDIADKMQRPLVLRVGFDGQDENKKFILPFEAANVVQIEIDWGDSTPLQIVNSPCNRYAEHSYRSEGEYTVRVFPHGPSINGLWLDHLGFTETFDSGWWRPLRSFDSLGSLGIISLEGLFSNAQTFNLPLSHLDVSNVRCMKELFAWAREFNQPIGSWNVSNVTSMDSMFRSATSFNQPLGRWNVGRVETMSLMFYSARAFNQPIGDWNVSNVQNMQAIFFQASSFNQSIGSWNVHNLNNAAHMFAGNKSFNQPIGQWDVSNVIDMRGMFFNSVFKQDLGDWDVSNVKHMERMFNRAFLDKSLITRWNLSPELVKHLLRLNLMTAKPKMFCFKWKDACTAEETAAG
eukprot:TRINITY_DN718_c0_g1_i1.p1 TRINITY_DN718_c0_g1~~TRINITY_DN718_c0_g1_i1.p1  ORF type:complete len:390 (-),score=59.39 TRINITY_DN718_c0_g1_i1:93-1262(-)